MILILTTTYGDGDFHPEAWLRCVKRAHTERHHVHRPAAHAAAIQIGHHLLHLGRRHPVVGRSGVVGIGRADKGAVLDPGDIVGVAPG